MPRTCSTCRHFIEPTMAVSTEHVGVEEHMCRECAQPLTRAIDDLIADGMEPFSPEGRDHCANCLDDVFDDEPITIRIGPWRRHTLCPTCADPVLTILDRAVTVA